MPIFYEVDVEKSLVVSIVEGRLDECDLREFSHATRHDPAVIPCDRSIFDCSAMTDLSVTASSVQRLALYEVPEREERRIAIVAPSDVSYGLARVFEGFRVASTDMRIAAFRTRKEALEWLELDVG